MHIIDNENIAHDLWKNRLNEYKTLKLLHFSDPLSLKQHLEHHTCVNVVYLVDYDFEINSPTGLELIQSLGITTQSILVTNRYDDIKLQKECIHLGIKIIPKPYIAHIPLQII